MRFLDFIAHYLTIQSFGKKMLKDKNKTKNKNNRQIYKLKYKLMSSDNDVAGEMKVKKNFKNIMTLMDHISLLNGLCMVHV